MGIPCVSQTVVAMVEAANSERDAESVEFVEEDSEDEKELRDRFLPSFLLRRRWDDSCVNEAKENADGSSSLFRRDGLSSWSKSDGLRRNEWLGTEDSIFSCSILFKCVGVKM